MTDSAYCPAAWTREDLSQEKKVFAVYTEPRYGGMVTIDYTARVFRLGMSQFGPVNSTKKYTGRGWRAQLEQDATAYLNEALGNWREQWKKN